MPRLNPQRNESNCWSATINHMKNEIQTGKTNDVTLETCRNFGRQIYFPGNFRPFRTLRLSSESAVTPTCQSPRPRGFVSVLLYPLRLSSSRRSEYSATPVSQRLLSRGAVVPALRAHPYRKTKNCEPSGAHRSIIA